MRPVLFLDVDGVLNSIRKCPWPDETVTEVEVRPGIHMPIRTSTRIGERLQEIDVEIRWLTTWRHSAPTLIAPLVGLPEDLEVVEWAQHRGEPTIYGKRRAVEAWRIGEGKGRPFVWADDELCGGALRTQVKVRTRPVHHVLIGTRYTHGITPEVLDDLDRWVKAVA